MDNCAIHHGDEIVRLVEDHGKLRDRMAGSQNIPLTNSNYGRLLYRVPSPLLARLQPNRAILLVLEGFHQGSTRLSLLRQPCGRHRLGNTAVHRRGQSSRLDTRVSVRDMRAPKGPSS